MTDRTDCTLDQAGWNQETRLAAVQSALALVCGVVTEAETDIPWAHRDRWPEDVRHAAEWLRAKYVPASERAEGEAAGYMQTGVQRTLDAAALRAFTTFAPYAYDATFWSEAGEVASLNVEATSLVVALTVEQQRQLTTQLGESRVVPLQEWRARHPPVLRRLVGIFRRN